MEVNIHLLCTEKPTLFYTEVGKYVIILCPTDVFQKKSRCDFGEKNRVLVIFVFLYLGFLDIWVIKIVNVVV